MIGFFRNAAKALSAAALAAALFGPLGQAAVGAGSAMAQDAVETGLAAFYSDDLAGATTASGDTYDPAALTTAHRDHDFGTVLLVTRVDNGASVTVTVTDRGPHDEERLVDLSRAAAEALDMIKDGMVEVTVVPAP